MYIKYAFLADSVTQDAGGKLTAVGIFDLIYTRKFPTVHRDMNLVMVVEGIPSEKGDHKLIVELRDEDANKLFGFEPTFTLMPGKVLRNVLRAQLMFKLQDFPFQHSGQYEFVIFVDGRFLGRVPLTVQKVNIEEAGEK